MRRASAKAERAREAAAARLAETAIARRRAQLARLEAGLAISLEPAAIVPRVPKTVKRAPIEL